MPIPFLSAFAAGAASAAAQQEGKTESEQLQKAQVAALMVDELDAKEGRRGAAKLAPTPAPDPLVAIEKAHEERAARGTPPHRKPTQPPGPGLLLKLAHWLNLK